MPWPRSDRIGVDFNENRIVDAVPLSVEGSTLVDGTLCRAEFHSVGNLDDGCVREELLDPADRVHCRLAQCRKPMTYVVELAQYGALFPWVAKLLHGLFNAFQSAGQAAAALLNDARLIAGEFIDDRAREDERYVFLAVQFFERG
jgi:hypothetical protein